MNVDEGLKLARIEAEQIAASHLTYIMTNGERGRSAMLNTMLFEDSKEEDIHRRAVLLTEYYILTVLTQAMEEELKRTEEEEN